MFTVGIKEVDAVELVQWLSNDAPGLRVIDVRQMQEIAGGTVPKAEAVPLHTLPERVRDFSPADKLVVLCRSGARSTQACLFLQQQGYTEVYNLRGGMMAWLQSGLPAYPLA